MSCRRSLLRTQHKKLKQVSNARFSLRQIGNFTYETKMDTIDDAMKFSFVIFCSIYLGKIMSCVFSMKRENQ